MKRTILHCLLVNVLALSAVNCGQGNSNLGAEKDPASIADNSFGEGENRFCRTKQELKKYSEDEYQTSTPSKPIEIWTPKQFAALADSKSALGSHLVLCQDIDLASWYGGHPQFMIGKMNDYFYGSLNGNKKAIRNFKYAATSGSLVNSSFNPVGIFGAAYYARFFDLKIIDAVIASTGGDSNSASVNTGVLLGFGHEVEITNVRVQRAQVNCSSAPGKVSCGATGGLAGILFGSSIVKFVEVKESTVIGRLRTSALGYFLGRSLISHSKSENNRITGDNQVAGFANIDDRASISTSKAVNNLVQGKSAVGGFVASMVEGSSLKDVMASGSIKAQYYAGGLVGIVYGEGAQVSNTYSNVLVDVLVEGTSAGHIFSSPGAYGSEKDIFNFDRKHQSFTTSSVLEAGVEKRSYVSKVENGVADATAYYLDANGTQADPLSVSITSADYFMSASNAPMDAWEFSADKWEMIAGKLDIPAAGYQN